MNCRTKVKAGACGSTTDIRATSEDSRYVSFAVESDCEKIKALASQLAAVDAYMEITLGFDGELLKAAKANLKGCCAGCAVPPSLFKSMQIAAGLALPRDVSISFAKEEDRL